LPSKLKIAIGIFGVLFISAIAGYWFVRYQIRKSFPETNEALTIASLRQQVEVGRDDFGVPRIAAQNEHDLMFALGYVHAQDRLWQMDMGRRIAQGRLSEIIGEKTIPFDKMFRIVGLRRIAEEVEKHISKESHARLESYAAGVNAFIESHKGKYPIEFDLLRYEPESWQPVHSIMMARLMAWELNLSWWVDLTLGGIVERVGFEKAREIFPTFPSDVAPIVPSSEWQTPALSFLQTAQDYCNFRGIGGTLGGSNAWVVAPSKSASGASLLANDVHLQLTNPSKFYEVSLSAPQYDDVTGGSVPGIPGVVLGHNVHIAWGLTNVMADDADFYIEQVDSTNPNNYLYDGQSLPMTVREEELHIKGIDTAQYVTIRSTHHGPIITDIKTNLKRAEFLFVASMRWTGAEMSDQVEAFNRINKAKNWDEFLRGVKEFSGPGQNFVYGDAKGNIGYWCGVKLPMRSRQYSTTLPLTGWTKETEWQGFVPFEQLPHLYNPPEGFIATANNKIVDDTYPYHISDLWEPPSRIQRLREVFGKDGKFEVRDFELLQNDQFSFYARELAPYIVDACSARIDAPYGELVMEYFKNWNFKFTKEDIATAVFQQFLTRLMQNIFEDEMGVNLFHDYVVLVNVPIRVTMRLVQEGNSTWFDNLRTSEIETRDDIVRKSMREAIYALREKFGDETKNWRWGDMHQLVLQHPFGLQKPLDRVFNLGPFPYSGGSTTMMSGEYSFTGVLHPNEFEQAFGVTVAASFRHIVDMSKPHESRTVLPTGQSAQVFNKHFDDQVAMYVNGVYKTTRADGGVPAKERLTLYPAR
jgi:penicillin amidase